MTDLRRTLKALHAPPPPESLREPTLRRALAAWPETPARPHWIDRLWSNRRLRFAWVASLLVLALLDLAATPSAIPGWSRPGPTLADARLALSSSSLAMAGQSGRSRSGS